MEKLREFFAKRGLASTTEILAEKISTHFPQTAPLALAKAVTTLAIAKGATASASTLILTKGALKIMAWSKAKTVVLATGVILLAGTGGVLVKNDFFPREPGYQGRQLSDWLADADFDQPAEKRRVASEAIRQMGARTVPFLLADLGDEKYKRFHYSREDHRTADDQSRQATWGFDALGPIAKPAIPELEKILEKNPGYAPLALAGIGPDALPQLLKAFTNENFWVRDNTTVAIANAIYSGKITAEEASATLPIAIHNLTYENSNELFQGNTRHRAASLLGALKQSPDISVPALIQGLGDTNASVAAECAFALSEFGAQAKTAIPELTRLANSTNSFVKDKAQQSLKTIQEAR